MSIKTKSPVFEILNVYKECDMCMGMIYGGCYHDKYEWRRYIWDIAWSKFKEDEEYNMLCQNSFMYKIIGKALFLNWWIISDLIPLVIRDCETMA